MIFLVVLVPALLVGLWYLRTPKKMPDGSWTATVPLTSPSRVEASSPKAVARALGRVESKFLLHSPSFALGLAFSAMVVLVFGIMFGVDNGQPWDQHIQLAPWFAHPLVGMTVLAAYGAVTRSRRDHTDEMFDACPTSDSTRTVGFLLSSATPIAALVIVLGLVYAVGGWTGPMLFGPISLDNVGDLVGAVALGAGGVALGVALGRWVRFPLAPLVMLALITVATTKINGLGDPDWNRWSPLATAPAVPDAPPLFIDRAMWWHLGWIVSLTVLVAVLAVARHRRDLVVLVVGSAAVLTGSLTAWGSGGAPADAAMLASRVTDPAAHQSCIRIATRAQVCVYREYSEVAERLAAELAPVAQGLPPEVPLLTMRQHPGDVADLQPAVRRLIGDRAPQVNASGIAVEFGLSQSVLQDARLNLAAAAVGIPPRFDARQMPKVVAGQARGVVALWLSAHGLAPARAQASASSGQAGSADSFERGQPGDDPCRNPALAWSGQDLQAARALLALPQGTVQKVVFAGWARWTDANTGTDELMSALQLTTVGPFDKVVTRPGGSC